MAAGQLDRRIVLQRVTESQTSGGSGQVNKSWGTLATVWAKYEPESGAESASDGQQRVSWQPAKFKLRWRSDVSPTTKDRITFDGLTWDILGVGKPDRNRWVVLTCKARGEGVAP